MRSKSKGMKKATTARGMGETLFIDARNMGTMVDRVHKELTTDDLAKIADTYHDWRGTEHQEEYEDVAGFCKSTMIEDNQSQ